MSTTYVGVAIPVDDNRKTIRRVDFLIYYTLAILESGCSTGSPTNNVPAYVGTTVAVGQNMQICYSLSCKQNR